MWKVKASLTSKVNVYHTLSQTKPLDQHILFILKKPQATNQTEKTPRFSVSKNLLYYFLPDMFPSSVQCMAKEREAGSHMEVIKREMKWQKAGKLDFFLCLAVWTYAAKIFPVLWTNRSFMIIVKLAGTEMS